MNVSQINESLLSGNIDRHGIFPHIDALKLSSHIFDVEFGIPQFTNETGIVVIRGARQYGKSTWLERHLRQCIEDFGAGSAFYLNGDELRSNAELSTQIRFILNLFPPDARIRRIYIDEITAVAGWQQSLKRLADAGELRDVLIITTGSKATDLRRGTERLPGRKGKLSRTAYYFTPISFSSFQKQATSLPPEDLLPAYILSGGCPLAAVELLTTGCVHGFVTEMIRDWIYGACAASGRDRSSLIGVMDVLIRYGGTPTGQAKIAREAGLANNTVAGGYLELLMDNCCLSTSHAWDRRLLTPVRRKPAKYHFVNLLAALSWHPDHPATIADFRALSPADHGKWYEWLVAQELWRKAVIAGAETPEYMVHWRSDNHEIDFVVNNNQFYEVKYGKASPMEFSWFASEFPGSRLTVISTSHFSTGFCRGITMEDFLGGNENSSV